ncbi:hypothetical protein Tco_0927762 [Tanacetum coccineum]
MRWSRPRQAVRDPSDDPRQLCCGIPMEQSFVMKNSYFFHNGQRQRSWVDKFCSTKLGADEIYSLCLRPALVLSVHRTPVMKPLQRMKYSVLKFLSATTTVPPKTPLI